MSNDKGEKMTLTKDDVKTVDVNELLGKPSIGIAQDVKIGTPKVTRTWPKAPVRTEVKKEGDRFAAIVHFEGVHTERLPGLHPTELDAQNTLEAWVKENLKS